MLSERIDDRPSEEPAPDRRTDDGSDVRTTSMELRQIRKTPSWSWRYHKMHRRARANIGKPPRQKWATTMQPQEIFSASRTAGGDRHGNGEECKWIDAEPDPKVEVSARRNSSSPTDTLGAKDVSPGRYRTGINGFAPKAEKGVNRQLEVKDETPNSPRSAKIGASNFPSLSVSECDELENL